MMRKTTSILAGVLGLVAGVVSSCRSPGEPAPCTTCDTTHVPNPNDTSSHAFIWTEYHLPTNQVAEDDATGCWVFDRQNVLLCNYYLYRFDGVSIKKVFLWNSEGGEAESLSGFRIFAFDTDDVWLTHSSLFFHIDGKRYLNELVGTAYRLDNTGVWHYPEDGGMNAAWGTSSKDMFFVGDKGTILHFDGTTWIKYPKVTDQNLFSVWGTSHDDVWAAGFDHETATSALLHFDGTSWLALDLSTIGNIGPGKHGLDAVWTCDSATHRKVFATGSLIWHKLDNGPWTSDSGQVGNALGSGNFAGIYASTGNAANDFFGAGGWGFVAHWNGNSWHRYGELWSPSTLGFAANQIHMKGNTVCVVGYKDGTGWIAIGQRQ